MSLLIIVEALDLGDIFYLLFDGVDISIHYKRVVAITSSTPLASKISLILIFFARLALIGQRLLVLIIRYISGRSISGLSLSGIFLLFLYLPIPLEKC